MSGRRCILENVHNKLYLLLMKNKRKNTMKDIFRSQGLFISNFIQELIFKINLEIELNKFELNLS